MSDAAVGQVAGLMTDAARASDAGDLVCARQYLEAALHEDLTNWEVHKALAVVLEKTGDLAAARFYYAFATHLGCEDGSSERALDRIDEMMRRAIT